MKQKIGDYEWEILFVAKERIPDCDGQTKPNDFQILIRRDLSNEVTELVLRHEIIHAILDTQGRIYQKKFDLEEVCEFIAWKLPEINDIMNNIIKSVEMIGR